MKKLIDFSPETGVSHSFHLDEHTGDTRIIASQDVSGLLDSNRAQANEPVKRGAEWRKVATIPLVVLFDLRRRGIIGDQKAFKRWLNDPDNRFFRTSPEHV